jgi:hypothetical protein
MVGVLVAVPVGVTLGCGQPITEIEAEFWFATYTRPVVGLLVTPVGASPTGMVWITV